MAGLTKTIGDQQRLRQMHGSSKFCKRGSKFDFFLG